MNNFMLRIIGWFANRVGVIYIILFLFFISCVDLKMLSMRIKVRHLNDTIPNFSTMLSFSNDQNGKQSLDWEQFKKYFDLILSYMPDDAITKQLLGYVDYYSGEEQNAITLFKSSALLNGHDLFLSDYNLGVIYYKKGMWAEAGKYLLKAISANQKLTLMLLNDSIVYRQIFASSQIKYSLSDELNKDQTKAFILLVSSLNNMKQYDKVLLISNLALIKSNITNKDIFYYYAGLSLLEQGQLEKAFLLFQKSLTIEKNNPDVYYYIADIYQKIGQLEQARDLIQVSYALHQKHDPRFPYESHVNLRFF